VSSLNWTCVFRGSGPTDAWLVHDWLVRNDIEVQVRGDLVSLGGRIPMHESWPTLWVRARDVQRAAEALESYRAPRLVHPSWVCAKCGEENEATFDSCWSCQHER
jgi:hypothetical protein